MKALLSLVLFSTVAMAHNSNGTGAQHCPHEPTPEPAPTLESLRPKMDANNIEILRGNTVSGANVGRFMTEYEKFPQSLRSEMVGRGAKIRLMEGTGVGIDPTLGDTPTKDGTRSWANVPGAGGEVSRGRNVPTRIAIDHLYDSHGSSNLILHEHAHTLDSIYGGQAVSNSDVWKNLMRTTPKSESFTREICGQYCLDREEERFAELLSYYFACPATKAHLEREVPAIADFFSKLTDVKSVVDGKDPRGEVSRTAVVQTPVQTPTPSPTPAPASATAAPQEECLNTDIKNSPAIQPITALVPHVQKILQKTDPVYPTFQPYKGRNTSAAGMK